MEQKIPHQKIEDFIKKQSFPLGMGWGSLLHCLFGKQSCHNLAEQQQTEIRSLLKETLASSDFSLESFDKTVQSLDSILNAPYIGELRQAIEETNTLINRFKVVSGRQLGVVDNLEKLTLQTVLSDKSPQEMVVDLRGAFQNLVTLMEEDAKVLENLSKTDQLTNLANRRGFDECILSSCQPDKGVGLYLMMIDIDHFKKFNDQHGHLVGDEVLALVAGIIAKTAKSKNVCGSMTNLAARYGGEEFAIILPAYTDQKCMALAEGMRSRIEHYPVVIRNAMGDILKKDVHLTVSIGVASIHPLWLENQANCSHNLIQAADQAMYEAKKRGRNMICQHKVYKGADGKLTSVIL